MRSPKRSSEACRLSSIMMTMARSCSSVNGRFASASTRFTSSFNSASGFAPDGCWTISGLANRRMTKIATVITADHSSEMNYSPRSFAGKTRLAGWTSTLKKPTGALYFFTYLLRAIPPVSDP